MFRLRRRRTGTCRSLRRCGVGGCRLTNRRRRPSWASLVFSFACGPGDRGRRRTRARSRRWWRRRSQVSTCAPAGTAWSRRDASGGECFKNLGQPVGGLGGSGVVAGSGMGDVQALDEPVGHERGRRRSIGASISSSCRVNVDDTGLGGADRGVRVGEFTVRAMSWVMLAVRPGSLRAQFDDRCHTQSVRRGCDKNSG